MQLFLRAATGFVNGTPKRVALHHPLPDVRKPVVIQICTHFVGLARQVVAKVERSACTGLLVFQINNLDGVNTTYTFESSLECIREASTFGKQATRQSDIWTDIWTEQNFTRSRQKDISRDIRRERGPGDRENQRISMRTDLEVMNSVHLERQGDRQTDRQTLRSHATCHKAPVVRSFVDDHRILHVVAGEWNHSNDGIRAQRIFIHLIFVLRPVPHDW